MSGHKHKDRSHHRNRGNRPAPAVGEKGKEFLERVDEDNPTIKMFRQYSQELDDKHDRHERIVKISRDITIESKRIIFLLHQTNIESNKEKILTEADTRLKALTAKNFKTLAEELDGHDPYLYHRAYTSGAQEFIEALTFYQYVKSESMEPFKSISESLQYSNPDGAALNLTVPQYDFILGIGDLTGELMRRCINNLGVGNINDCFKLCNFVKDIYTGFLGVICPGCKEMGRKIYTLKQSLAKMELVCYNIQIRGTEIPKHMLANVIENAAIVDDVDEGYF